MKWVDKSFGGRRKEMMWEQMFMVRKQQGIS